MNQLTQEQKIELKKLIIKHEGERDKPYKDTLGNITIGRGRNLSGTRLHMSEIELMYQNDVDYLYAQLCQFPWYLKLNENRQIALIDMSFMGWQRFLGFEKMIHYLEIGAFEKASLEILDSLYAKQVGQRAIDIANIISKGELN